MSADKFFLTAWDGRMALLLAIAGVAGLMAARRLRLRAGYFLAAMAVLVLALASPLDALARDTLFTAHMVQHLLLLLFAPALFLLGLSRQTRLPREMSGPAWAVAGWLGGIGAMWIWHVPALCDAASSIPAVRTLQVISLLVLGGAFWLPMLSPREHDRLAPLPAVAYLFAACLACSSLGIVLTLTPVEVCPIFCQPADRWGILGWLRGNWGFTAERDRQVGGLVMWVPMCLIFLAAVLAQLARWHGEEPSSAAGSTS